eukprot:TRINITY_DN31037_c0_g1_i4.p1 TRINITY_DN31037_c0_g1~~TRINITY_DN31037_c0_g1_i4.p1  ORF type:complete len:353 (+),score=20.08 TRINITY_DN31037_c0_g1_i4:155-1213(+)
MRPRALKSLSSPRPKRLPCSAASRRSTCSRQGLSVFEEICQLGVAGGEQLREVVRAGRLTVDGRVVRDPLAVAEPNVPLSIDGVELDRKPPLLLKFHKPYDVVCSLKDHRGRRDLSTSVPGLVSPVRDAGKEGAAFSWSDYSPLGLRPFVAVSQYHPVGRLDRDTTGLLLFSRHGGLTFKLLDPRQGIPRRYVAVVEGDVVAEGQTTGALAGRLAAGVATECGTFAGRLLKSEKLTPDEAILAGHTDYREQTKRRLLRRRNRQPHQHVPIADNWQEHRDVGALQEKSRVCLEVCEGKNRMVRKMLFRCGHSVVELHRTQYGQVHLHDLRVGDIARADSEEERWALTLLNDEI